MIIKGKDISIEETPQGCILGHKNKTIRIANQDDALILIQSLIKMIRIQHPQQYKEFLKKILEQR